MRLYITRRHHASKRRRASCKKTAWVCHFSGLIAYHWRNSSLSRQARYSGAIVTLDQQECLLLTAGQILRIVYQDTSAAPGSVYAYSVAARNACGVSGPGASD